MLEVKDIPHPFNYPNYGGNMRHRDRTLRHKQNMRRLKLKATRTTVPVIAKRQVEKGELVSIPEDVVVDPVHFSKPKKSWVGKAVGKIRRLFRRRV